MNDIASRIPSLHELLTPTLPTPQNIGTAEHPFENVLQACDFLKYFEHLCLKSDQSYFTDLGPIYPFNDWKDPQIAFLAPDVPESNFVASIVISHETKEKVLKFKANLTNRKFLYRGQLEDYKSNVTGKVTCRPNAFRDESKDYYLDYFIQSQEMELVIQSHPLCKVLANNGIKLGNRTYKFLPDLGGLTQHYFQKTTFLDLTSDLEAAKFFATLNYNAQTDTYSVEDNSDKLGVIYIYEIKFPSDAFQATRLSKDEKFHLSHMGKQIFPRSGAQKGFLLNLNKGLDLNDLPHVQKIYFKHDKNIAQQIFDTSNAGSKYMPYSILDEYWQQANHKVVSKAAVQVNLRRNPKEHYASIAGKLHKYGLEIQNYTPSFPPELLDKYYEDIKNGFWEEFCKDITFVGDKNNRYKDSLLNLPYLPENRWAFFRS